MLETIIHKALQEYKIELQKANLLDNDAVAVLDASNIQYKVKQRVMNTPIKKLLGKGM